MAEDEFLDRVGVGLYSSPLEQFHDCDRTELCGRVRAQAAAEFPDRSTGDSTDDRLSH
jgi:hypothetical protein